MDTDEDPESDQNLDFLLLMLFISGKSTAG